MTVTDHVNELMINALYVANDFSTGVEESGDFRDIEIYFIQKVINELKRRPNLDYHKFTFSSLYSLFGSYDGWYIENLTKSDSGIVGIQLFWLDPDLDGEDLVVHNDLSDLDELE